ncbi:hypothetical protein RHGRI_038663 [Rhododendron griersonianum]|uniref:Uncharacterized protein n=1 Tax=Rhododendron griersonianum TaxID=479676 RepID=A0AAV6HJG6_9ERIC|nr:hypothetical protein RHGRI_038663 [Rhododendron griersonianum]
MCNVCNVFGHSNAQCAKKASTSSSSLSRVEVQKENEIHVGNGSSSLPQQPDNEWVQVRNGKQKVVQNLSNKGETVLAVSTSVLVEQEQSDSDEDLLGVLEKVVSSAKGTPIAQDATPMEGSQLPQATSSEQVINRVGEVASTTSIAQAEHLNPKPPDILSGESKEKEPAQKQPLSKSAQKKLRKQVREQALCSFSRRGK